MTSLAVTYARSPFGKVVNPYLGLLADDAAIVTGAAQGNGAAIAKGLAASSAAFVPCDINLAASRSNPAVMEELFQHALVKRFAEPEAPVGAALFLSSTLSSFMTGVTLPVDGGYLAIYEVLQ